MSKWVGSSLIHITSYSSDMGFARDLSARLILLWLPLFTINHLYWVIRHWYYKVFLLSSRLILKLTLSSPCVDACLNNICDIIKKYPHQTTSPNKNLFMQVLVKREWRLSFILSEYICSSYYFFFKQSLPKLLKAVSPAC